MLATGVEDQWVEFPGYQEFIGRSVHWCIVCDGYEMRGQRVVVAANALNFYLCRQDERAFQVARGREADG